MDISFEKFNIRFEPRYSQIFKAVEIEQKYPLSFCKFLKVLFLILFLFGLFFYFFPLVWPFFPILAQSFLGLFLIFLTFWIVTSIWLSFFEQVLKKTKLEVSLSEILVSPEKFNLANYLSFDSAKLIFKTKKLVKSKKLGQVSSTTLFFKILEEKRLNFIFQRALLNQKEIKKTLRGFLKSFSSEKARSKKASSESKVKNRNLIFDQSFQETLYKAAKIAIKKGSQRIGLGDIFSGLAHQDLLFKKILALQGLKKEGIENLCWWERLLRRRIEERKKWWQYNNLLRLGEIGRDWAAGYTINLDEFSLDISEIIKKKKYNLELLSHQKELESLERSLSRQTQNCALLVGEAGVGKRTLIEYFTQKIVFGESLPVLNYQRVLKLDMGLVIAGSHGIGEVESRLNLIFSEAIRAGNIILVIENLDQFIGGEREIERMNIAPVLQKYIQNPEFRIIASTTYEGFHKNIEPQEFISSEFRKIEIKEVSEEVALRILEKRALVMEQNYKLFTSYPAIAEIINLCSKYIQTSPFPKKAVDVLEEVMVYISKYTKSKVLLPEDVAKIVSEKTEIPVGKIKKEEKEILLNLENLIHRRIVDQEEAVKEVSNALRRARSEITKRERPMGTFLFLGPTGVGKTETSKALAEVYFGSEKRMIRLDMSEYQNIESIERLIGSPKAEGHFITEVRENPFSLVLLDEIEKAHPNILNLFLQVLDEGHLTDGIGRRVDFKNTIIIATSNAGAEIIRQDIQLDKKLDIIKEELLDHLFRKGLFRPEFINRFDGVVVFKTLSRENLLDIGKLMMAKVQKKLKERDIEIIVTPALLEKLIELGFNPQFGAREMRRVIQDKIENSLAKELIAGAIKPGDRIEINPTTFEISKV